MTRTHASILVFLAAISYSPLLVLPAAIITYGPSMSAEGPPFVIAYLLALIGPIGLLADRGLSRDLYAASREAVSRWTTIFAVSCIPLLGAFNASIMNVLSQPGREAVGLAYQFAVVPILGLIGGGIAIYVTWRSRRQR